MLFGTLPFVAFKKLKAFFSLKDKSFCGLFFFPPLVTSGDVISLPFMPYTRKSTSKATCPHFWQA